MCMGIWLVCVHASYRVFHGRVVHLLQAYVLSFILDLNLNLFFKINNDSVNVFQFCKKLIRISLTWIIFVLMSLNFRFKLKSQVRRQVPTIYTEDINKIWLICRKQRLPNTLVTLSLRQLRWHARARIPFSLPYTTISESALGP